MIFGEWIKFDKQINAFIVGYKPLETHGFPSLQGIWIGQVKPLKRLSA